MADPRNVGEARTKRGKISEDHHPEGGKQHKKPKML
jgi:hypothetical protein